MQTTAELYHWMIIDDIGLTFSKQIATVDYPLQYPQWRSIDVKVAQQTWKATFAEGLLERIFSTYFMRYALKTDVGFVRRGRRKSQQAIHLIDNRRFLRLPIVLVRQTT